MNTGLKNILFIMCDQLRADYLGCYGHQTIRTPNLDALAARSVRFDRAYVQSPVCGPSRMSFYTGRYVSSHGANWNRTPLRPDERTIADYLEPLGVETAIVGKTHIKPDTESLTALLVPEDAIKARAQGGFVAVERDDGVHRSAQADGDISYNRYLRANGFEGENPWDIWANSAAGPNGEILSAFSMRNAGLPARVPEPFSETAYMTDRAIDYVKAKGEAPWCLHLSFIKPHWPYMAPAPFHEMYGPDDIQPVIRCDAQKNAPHPIAQVMMAEADSIAFQEERTRKTVIPTYMGLISQIDAHIGRIVDTLKEEGRGKDTLIVFTSDHGDFLGDHWLADKAMFYEQGVRIPLIIHDPRHVADATRGRVRGDLVEAIDLAPTFLSALGGAPSHRLEGQNLMPVVFGTGHVSRQAVFSELDYGYIATGQKLGLAPTKSVGRMVRTADWKYVHFDTLPCQLFDLKNDPDELHDLGQDPACAHVRSEMKEHLLNWQLGLRSRVTETDEDVASWLDRVLERGGRKSGW